MNDGGPFDEETDALLALDALRPDEEADAELRAGLLPGDLAGAAAFLAEATAASPPARLRADTLARALSRRPAGRPAGAVRPCDPATGFSRAVADLSRLLASLTDAEWAAPAHPEHGRVRDLVAHLIGVERLVLRWLDPGDAVEELPDHVAATRPVIAELAAADPRAAGREWHDTASAVAAAAGSDLGRMVAFHDITVSVGGLLVMRTAELWAHSMDICQATGRPLPMMDGERMAALSAELMAAMPLAMTYGGIAQPGRAARFVLTGPAGGTYTVPLAPPPRAVPGRPAEPDVTIVADTAGLCRVAVRRLRAEQLDAAIIGDRALGELVLAGVGALARD